MNADRDDDRLLRGDGTVLGPALDPSRLPAVPECEVLLRGGSAAERFGGPAPGTPVEVVIAQAERTLPHTS